jgi:hypothetical protein
MRISLRWPIALSAICAITALTAAEQLKFEVASVKRTDRGIIKNSLGPGTVTLKGDPLKIVLMEAFKVKSYQIEGPSWLDEDCFDIVAKMPEGATSDQIPAMLQALLVERFKLAAHKEIARVRCMRWLWGRVVRNSRRPARMRPARISVAWGRAPA